MLEAIKIKNFKSISSDAQNLNNLGLINPGNYSNIARCA